jgi:hypothetical protein
LAFPAALADAQTTLNERPEIQNLSAVIPCAQDSLILINSHDRTPKTLTRTM